MAAPATVHEKSHPTAGVYLRIGVILFVVTALEVGLYEIANGERSYGAITAFFKPIFVETLLGLSAIKFALVAMFYMHLKQDSKLFSAVFVFPIIIAAVVILALLALLTYHHAFARSG